MQVLCLHVVDWTGEELPPAMVLRTKRPEPKTAGSMDQQQQQQ
jgi:hypothetical protein